jgi:hypothetical protein
MAVSCRVIRSSKYEGMFRRFHAVKLILKRLAMGFGDQSPHHERKGFDGL